MPPGDAIPRVGTTPPVVIANPPSDERFVALAERLVADGSVTPAGLQDELRAEYPRTIVRERSLSSESLRVWYVYREGRWVDGRSGEEA